MCPHRPEEPNPAVQSTHSLDAADASVSAVGTFAAGQSPQGRFPVVAGAEVGSFASGLAADGHPEAE
jgi:hypothetical protein